MKTNMFGDLQPKNYAEMEEAAEIKGVLMSECNADVEFNEDEGDFHGWTAEVRENESGEAVFSTLGYESKDELLKDLRALGVTDINEL